MVRFRGMFRGQNIQFEQYKNYYVNEKSSQNMHVRVCECERLPKEKFTLCKTRRCGSL